MRARWSSHRPPLSALLLFWLLTAAMVGVSLYLTGGTLAYARDDTYIHMAIARSVADYGVWGTTQHAFASAASSILWPLLLAGVYALFGVRDVWPLLLNLALGSAVLVVLARETAPYLAGHPRRQALLLVGTIAAHSPFALHMVAGSAGGRGRTRIGAAAVPRTRGRNRRGHAHRRQNIYEQQVQMGRFLAASYNDATVIGNDIGAISYYSDIALVDYIGLGDDQVARLVVSGGLNSETLDAIATARQARVAILYDEWLRTKTGPKPDAWTLVGRWANDGSLFTAYEVISFYAVTPADVAPLRANLEAFQPRLPSNVIFGINPALDAAGGP